MVYNIYSRKKVRSLSCASPLLNITVMLCNSYHSSSSGACNTIGWCIKNYARNFHSLLRYCRWSVGANCTMTMDSFVYTQTHLQNARIILEDEIYEKLLDFIFWIDICKYFNHSLVTSYLDNVKRQWSPKQCAGHMFRSIRSDQQSVSSSKRNIFASGCSFFFLRSNKLVI